MWIIKLIHLPSDLSSNEANKAVIIIYTIQKQLNCFYNQLYLIDAQLFIIYTLFLHISFRLSLALFFSLNNISLFQCSLSTTKEVDLQSIIDK